MKKCCLVRMEDLHSEQNTHSCKVLKGEYIESRNPEIMTKMTTFPLSIIGQFVDLIVR